MYTRESDREIMTSDFFKRLKVIYGYQDSQLAKDVVLENGCYADIAIWNNPDDKKNNSIPDICVVVICNPEHIKIQAADYIFLRDLGSLKSACFFVVNNNKETRVFYIDPSREGNIESFGDFPKASELKNDSQLKSFLSRMRNSSKEDLIRAFSRCHNIIRNNDKLSPEAAFDEISKIMFIKMLYEKNPDQELIYTRDTFIRDEKAWNKSNLKEGDYLNYLFHQVKYKYANERLFDSNDKVRIKRDSFLKILDELGSIGLAGMSDDVKGVAFESFLGKTFRGELGQFFTPRTIVDYMVDVLDIKEGELVCDPCCGSGGFLIRAFEKVQDDIDKDIQNKIIDISQKDLPLQVKENLIANLKLDFDKSRPGSRYFNLCNNYFYGVDANVRMARTSKMNMIMHGDGHVGVYLHDGLLDIGKIREGIFDVVLINPPFGVHVDRLASSDGHKSVDEIFDLKTSNAEQLFVERTLRLLKPGGRAALVLPEGIFNNTNTAAIALRKYVEDNAEILNVTSIPADVFLASGANIKPSILFIRKFFESEKISNKHKTSSNRILASLIEDAGINSLGLPSSNNQLRELAPVVRDWISIRKPSSSHLTRMIDLDDMEDWNILPFFFMKEVKYKEGMPVVKLSQILYQLKSQIDISDDTLYKRITVKLFNKGLSLRDQVKGSEIKTKKQFVVNTGNFIISKIDGKSGAFGFVPKELDGAIVTSDFPVFFINALKVVPEYLDLVLRHESTLNHIKAICTGSTGRKRLSVSKFLNLRIPLPSLFDQQKYVRRYKQLQYERERIEKEINSEIARITNAVFE